MEEERAVFGTPISTTGAAAWRNLGGVGPTYEILADHGAHVRIRLLQSEEELDYPRADAEADPLAP